MANKLILVMFMFNKETLSVIGEGDCTYENSVSFPIFQTSTFGGGGDYSYSRLSNPTREALERECALLEKGNYAFAFSSGLAAINGVFALLKKGDRVVVMNDIYGGTYRLITKIYSNYGIDFVFADLSDLNQAETLITKNTALVFAETPTNPMMKIADIKAIAEIAHKNGALFAVDNTFLTPVFQNPLTLGADIVVHSATKYISGHHDVVAGVVITSNDDIADRLQTISMTLGNALSPFESWLVLRGIRTLPMRMEKHQKNAFAAAEFLQSHSRVNRVIYPGLPQHSQHSLCAKQATGFGGVVTFYVKETKTARKLISGGKIIKFAESLGGFRSLITYPLTQTHASIPQDLREQIGITDKLIRLSVGLCNEKDIIEDLEEMLG